MPRDISATGRRTRRRLRWSAPDRLWAAAGVSAVGTQLTLVAMPLLAVAVLRASAAQTALLAAAGTAPFLLLGLPAGAWVDRWDRRRVMVVTDLLRAAALASVPAAAALGVLTLAHLAVVAFIVGALGVLFDVAALSAVPAVVAADDLTRLNGRLEVARAAAQTTGPAAGGALVQAVSAPFALLLDAVSYVGSALVLRRLPALPPAGRPVAGGTLRQVRDGLAFCWRHPYVRPLAMGAGWMNLWSEGLLGLLVPWAVLDLGMTAAGVGIVLAGANVGYLLGSATARAVTARLGVGPSIVLGAALSLGLVLVALPVPVPVAVRLAVALGASAAGSALWNVNAVSLRQATTAPEMMTRMNATNRFVIWGTMPLGAALGAALAARTGAAAAVVTCALAAPLCALPVAFSAVRRVRSMPGRPVAAELAAGGVR